MNRSSIFLFLMFMLLVACGTSGTKDQVAMDASLDTLAGQFAELDQLILKSPTDASLFAKRAVLQLKRDSLGLAVNDYKRAIALDSLDPAYHIGLADLFYMKIRLPEAEQYLLNAIRLGPNDPEPKLKLAEMKLFQRKYQESMDLVNDALRLEQGRAKGYHIKGFIYQETGDTAKAISSYRTAIEQDPDYFDPLLKLAVLHAEKGDELAMDYYNSALSIEPDNTTALYGKGMFAQEQGMDSIAFTCYDRIKVLEPNNALAYYNTGYIRLVHDTATADAREQFTMAIKLMPNYAQAYYNRGLAFEMDELLDSAYVDYKKALAIQPAFDSAAESLERLQKKGIRVAP
ncbi:MAG: tetratricopeptide repeat protein [Flavobacteriales bacterium]|nr:tetratricopeptide repeat protein [Flavobacteriales bacterium]MBK7241421.1 tetratricopeptide repeat protein [Flavobacteriales bacterium]MBK9535128.1 tetratricopeptide repeat protein [Flavobacteriales bacterium]MBP9139830.1 tetratricopeptide repeat protein [Flavobacteriales bacterium]HQV53226.1 tetratricopeptide repeat protein [Flavobacteriales bacterium]